MVSDPSDAIRNVVLVGFMASGKSTVGPCLARRLAWTFLDFDTEIERRSGRSVERIFADEGEAVFRTLEARLGAEVLARSGVVLAPGGGWPAVAGRMEGLPADTFSVWLDVDVETVLARARADRHVRPLLAGPDREIRARTLLESRRQYYQRARLHLDARRASPERLAEAIVNAMGVTS